MTTTQTLTLLELIKKVRDLKVNGDFLEALNLMESYIGTQPGTKNLQLTVIMQKTAYNRAEQDRIRGLTDQNAYNQSLARIEWAIEELLDDRSMPETGVVEIKEDATEETHESLDPPATSRLPWDAHLRKVHKTLAELIYDANEYRTLAKRYGVSLNTLTITQKPNTDWANIIDFIRENNTSEQARQTLNELLAELSNERPLNSTLKELQNWPEKP